MVLLPYVRHLAAREEKIARAIFQARLLNSELD
jgi:hypothetical protein